VDRLAKSCGTLPTTASAHRRTDTSWLVTVVPTVHALLDRGEATASFTVTKQGNHLILGRVDEDGPDPRFRLTALGGAATASPSTNATAGA
jgi:hypothetical protein